MSTAPSMRIPSAIICADWGKEPRKRAVYVPDTSQRVVHRIAGDRWTFAMVVKEASRWLETGPVVTAFDVPLGVPVTYFAAFRNLPGAGSVETFLDVLAWARSTPEFYVATKAALDWRLD